MPCSRTTEQAQQHPGDKPAAADGHAGRHQQAQLGQDQQQDQQAQSRTSRPAGSGACRLNGEGAQITVTDRPADPVQQGQPQITVHQPAPRITVEVPQPQITVRMPSRRVSLQELRRSAAPDHLRGRPAAGRVPDGGPEQIQVLRAEGQPEVMIEQQEAQDQQQDTAGSAGSSRPTDTAAGPAGPGPGRPLTPSRTSWLRTRHHCSTETSSRTTSAGPGSRDRADPAAGTTEHAAHRSAARGMQPSRCPSSRAWTSSTSRASSSAA
jgi:hypothetical protein